MINILRLWYKRFTARWMLRPSYCKHCGVDIRDFKVSNEVWAQIAPHIKHGNTLCYNCFSDVCLEIGLPSVWSLYHQPWSLAHRTTGVKLQRAKRCKVMLRNNARRCPYKAISNGNGNCKMHGGRRVAQVVFAEEQPFDAESLRRCKQVLDLHRRINDDKHKRKRQERVIR